MRERDLSKESEWIPSQEKIDLWFNMAKDVLEEKFVGEPLTTIELFWLRKTVIDMLKLNHDLEGTKAETYTAVDPVTEAVNRFLDHYGLYRKDFPGSKGNRRMDMDDPATLKYVRTYLRKAREEAHKPFLD